MLKRITSVMVTVFILVMCATCVTASPAPTLNLKGTTPSAVTPGTSAIGMCASSKYAFVNYKEWIEVFDIETNPYSPSYLTKIVVSYDDAGTKPMYMGDIRIRDNYLFVAAYSKNANTVNCKYIAVYDVSSISKNENLLPVATTSKSMDSATKQETAVLGTAGHEFNLIVGEEKAVALSATSGLYWFDVSDEAIAEAKVNGTYLPRTKAVTEADALVNKRTEANVVGRYSVGCIDGDYLYYTAYNSTKYLELFIADTSNDGFEVIGTYPIYSSETAANYYTEGLDMHVANNYIYLCSHLPGNRNTITLDGTTPQTANGVYILDVTDTKATGTQANPVAPNLVTLTTPSGSGLTNGNSQIGGVALDGDYMYVWGTGSKFQRIYMYDISNRQSPECIAQTGQLATTGARGDCLHSISVKDNVIYSCATTNGLVVHSLSDCVIDGITIKNEAGNEVTNLEQGTLTVNMTATSYASEPKEVSILLALYNNDELEDIAISTQELPANLSTPISGSINVPAVAGYRLKVMVWDSLDGMNIKSVTWDGDTAISTGVELVEASNQ
ncbi:MAG: hypothetical protein II997_05600 [Clostridia bacterium]|nr:hypothetical protein [Clostridia bacterium]